MTRKVKALGLALMALAALGMTAAVAQANHIDSGAPPNGTTHITGESIALNQFDTPVGPIACPGAKYDATYAGNTTAGGITLKPTFGNCIAFGMQATVDPNQCGILVTTPTNVAPFDTDHFDSVTHFECNVAPPMQITVGDPGVVCTIDIPAGTPTVPITDLANNTGAGPIDLTLKWTLEGIHYNTTPMHGSPCGTPATMKLTGEVTLKAFADAAHMAQVPLWIT